MTAHPPARRRFPIGEIVAFFSWLFFSGGCPPIDIPLLSFLALAPWIIYELRGDGRGFFRRAWLGTTVFGAYHLQWVWHLTGWAGPIGVVVLSIVYSLLQIPLVLALRYFLVKRRSPAFFVLPLACTANDVLREWLIGGIDWQNAGLALASYNTLAQVADFGRVWPLSFLLYASNGWLADLDRVAGFRFWRGPKELRRGVAIFLTVAVFLGYGTYRKMTLPHEWKAGPLAIGIQGNVPQTEKMKRGPGEEDPYHLRFLEIAHRAAAANPGADLFVWPETSVFPSIDDSTATRRRHGVSRALFLNGPRIGSGTSLGGQLRGIGQFSPGNGPFFILGTVSRDDMPKGGYDEEGAGVRTRNTVFLTRHGPRGDLMIEDRYDKRKLVPYGEYLPMRGLIPKRELLKKKILELVGFIPSMTPGETDGLWRIATPGGEWTFGINICFEIVYPELFRSVRRSGAEFVVNASNDAWYEDSAEMDLVHLSTMLRAIECRTSVFRVSNTGISTLIDPCGREDTTVEVDGKRKEVTGALVGRIPISAKVSPFVAAGDIVGWSIVFAAALAAGFEILRRKERNVQSENILSS